MVVTAVVVITKAWKWVIRQPPGDNPRFKRRGYIINEKNIQRGQGLPFARGSGFGKHGRIAGAGFLGVFGKEIAEAVDQGVEGGLVV
jgi:hypothetical protein